MEKMPMGFSWAPCIAQRTSNTLVRGCGLCWVDNFLILGKDAEDYGQKRNTFLERARSVGLKLDDVELAPRRGGTALGVEFDLIQKRYRMDPQWVARTIEKLGSFQKENAISILDLYTVCGTLIWRSQVMGEKLCKIPHIMALLGAAAKRVAAGGWWTDLIPIPKEAALEFTGELNALQENRWKDRLQIPEGDTAQVWSDASNSYSMYMVLFRGVVMAAERKEVPAGEHIYYSELKVAVDGVTRAYELGFRKIQENIDNAPAGQALERGVSTNFSANRILQRIPHDALLTVKWWSTIEQLADPWTREKDGVLRPLPAVGQYMTEPAAPQGTGASQATVYEGTETKETRQATNLKGEGKYASKIFLNGHANAQGKNFSRRTNVG
jgi:hypothetical protein